jgi:ELWxxDGT repeat protein
MKRILPFLLMLAGYFSNAQLSILKDINQTSDPNNSGIDAYYTTSINGVLFFSGRSGAGQELWKSDGTPAGTILVKDIYTGSNSSSPSNFIDVNGMLFFLSNNGTSGTELWKSDGTEAGTVLIKDIQAGSGSSAISNMIAVNNILFFTITDGSNFLDLWKSDGTAAGTILVKNNIITTGSPNFANVNGTLFFAGQDGANGVELWKSDGTAAGTVLIEDIYTGTNSSAPDNFYAIGNILYFIANNGSVGYELWKSDGTAAGTDLVEDIFNGVSGSSPDNFISYNGSLFFTAFNGINNALWQSDGTEAGTTIVKSPFDENSTIDNVTVAGNTLYFTIDAYDLWKSDGTPAGTTAFKNVGGYADDFTSMNGELYFVAQKELAAGSSIQIWRSNGTEAGTVLVTDLPKGTAPGTRPPNSLVAISNTLYFVADDGTNGNELWKTDGTPSGNTRLTNLPATSASSAPDYFTEFNGNLYFTATSGDYGRELWTSNGTSAGTVLLKDIAAGAENSSNPSSLTKIGDKIYFVAKSTTDNKLWKTDGTPAGTVEIGGDLPNGSEVAGAGNLIFFPNYHNNVFSIELWKSDGTTAGTSLVDNIGGSISANPTSLVNFQDKLYFIANDAGTSGLWTSNGGLLNAGTNAIKTFTFLKGLKNENGALYFFADDGTSGLELWKSDGTAAGTVLVKDINAGGAGGFVSTDIFQFETVDGIGYFVANDGANGKELWKTDGTAAGTTLVLDIYTGASSSNISQLTSANGLLYFTADDGIHGVELWKSDGTEAGTQLVSDIYTGTSSAYPYNLLELNGYLYFSSFDGTIRTLWKSNGKECGTIKVTNNTTVDAGGVNEKIIAIGDNIYITGYAAGPGNEIFIHNVTTDLSLPAGCRSTQTITFTLGTKTYGDAPFTLGATSDAGLPIEYVSSDPSIASINGDIVTILKAGTVKITASQEGDVNYEPAAPVEVSLVINKATQTITFPAITNKTVGDAPFTLTGSSTSGLALSYNTTTPTKVTIAGGLVTLKEAGTVRIVANQAGNENYSPSTAVEQSFCINPAKPVITLSQVIGSSGTLTSSSATGNQWFLNGTKLTDEKNATLTVTEGGIYSVQVTIDGCTSVISDNIPVVITDIETQLGHSVSVYPNPVYDKMTITLPGAGKKEVSIVGIHGKQGQRFVTDQSSLELSAENYSSGVYTISIKTTGGTSYLKFVKH